MNLRCIAVFIGLFGCAENQSSENAPFNTVDSNVDSVGDSTPAIVHLDRAGIDTSYTVALDSAGRTITPQDTASH